MFYDSTRDGNEPSEPSDEQDFTSRASEDHPELAARRKLLTLARSAREQGRHFAKENQMREQ